MKSHASLITCGLALSAGFFFAGSAAAEQDSVTKEVIQLPTKEGVAEITPPQFSPYAGRNFPTKVYWGDTHLHTAVSVDAGTMNRIGQEDAFRFARGEEITTTHGLRAKLSRPLDFLVISDHAEMYGLMPQLLSGDQEILSTEPGKRWYDALTKGDNQKKFDTAMEIVVSLSGDEPPIKSDAAVKNAWQNYTALADKYNEPGRFTALIGYEWTAIGGFNLHRNVIFRGDASVANRTVPLSQYDSQNPEDLWKHLAALEDKIGAEVLAIPHNGNLSNGRMFTVETFDGQPLTKELAAMRAQYEPLVEVTQIKGDGETHPFLSPNDEFADYESWDKSNLNGTEAKTKDMLQWEYAREALKNGLKLEDKLGVNPYKFGMIGSTDSHTSMAAVEEENFFGKHSGVEPEPHRWEHVVIEAPDPEFTIKGWQQAAGGYAGIWATENTREAIFDAMKRKETYATTGPRMTVRFFGGWDFDDADAKTRLPASAGYAKGVPMGGDLSAAPEGKAPTFLVAAAKDPYSGNLDRIQIVKGWMNADGETEEKVYDVVWSDDRKPGPDGKLPPVGNTVDVENATWSNSIGEPEMITVWTDPDFDPDQRAFYYARVIEIPTPRWTAYEAKRFNVEMTGDVPMTTQERAYTSPIWYTPRG
ncbi:DUF3604 domain-containing protein [Methyloceanibacter caenitepidi]|uniref:DUF3604 domain-containing protein n=1 Tax=Methyloceanibacter caenitepidi TaxID=1384459 RepID=A0A0A8K0V9_9HYPH|nr:DUF3604 domain-containing protein [Methyloceanibacter caenitepidi]BAQ16555.1 hypothetical protein GL4_1095 [Methyloceanibacter caenitepidi]